MMLCDISIVFNSFADAFGLMYRKRSSESRQVLVSFQSTESLGRLQYAGGGPAQCHGSILPSFHVAADALDVRLRGEARRIALNIAKLPEPLQKIAKISGSVPWLLTHSGQAADVKQNPSNGPASRKTSMIGAPVQIPPGNRWRDSGASNLQLPLACRDPSSEPRHGESPNHVIRMIGRPNSSRHVWRVFVALTGNTIMRQT